MIYHGSQELNLEWVHPSMSGHGRCYVYGTHNPVVATLFMVPWNDYMFRVGYHDSKLYVVENCPYLFTKTFWNKRGYLYELEQDSFFKYEKLWHGEMVSELPAKVRTFNTMDNIYDVLSSHIQKGEIVFYSYPERPEFYPRDDEDLLTKAAQNIERFGEQEKKVFLFHHPSLENRLNKLIRKRSMHHKKIRK